MNRTVSLYLDVVRLCAALLVVVSHFSYTRLSGGEYLFIRELKLGSDAVILFFVLSGYVIAYVSANRDRTLTDYSLSRLSRLYSVAFPALLMTVLLDPIGQFLDPELYDGWWNSDSQPIFRFFANLFFVNELWFSSIRPFTNGPYWSLGYEFWYYALFGAAYYYTGRLRLTLVTLIVLISGPKIMILLPIWLMGVWTYRFNQRTKVSIPVGWILFIVPIIVYAWLKSAGIYLEARSFTMQILGEHFVRSQLKFSDEFLISYLYGGLIAINFIGINAIAPVIEKGLVAFERPIRYWAGLTFSIYLFHYPLLQFFSALYGMSVHNPMRHLVLLGSTLGAIVLLGNVTEKKKHVARRILTNLMGRCGFRKDIGLTYRS